MSCLFSFYCYIGKTNVHRYVLAAQSGSLRQFARQVPGTPIVHMKRSVMVLEPVSDATERAKGKVTPISTSILF